LTVQLATAYGLLAYLTVQLATAFGLLAYLTVQLATAFGLLAYLTVQLATAFGLLASHSFRSASGEVFAMIRPIQTTLVALVALATSGLTAASANAKDYDGALNWIPAEVSTLIAIDLEGARSTPFFKELQKEIIDLAGFGREVAQMKREGLDVMASVKTIVYAGPDDVIKKAKQSLVILEGTFDQAKIKDHYSKSKSKVTLVEKTSAVGPYFQIGDHSCVAFNGNYAIFGSKALFESALTARAANQGGKNAKVAALVARFKGSKHGFGVITGSTQLKKFLGKDFGQVQDVKGAAMGFDFSAGFSLKIVGLFGDASKASSVATSVKSEINELTADPDLKEAGIDDELAKVTTVAAGSEVKLELTLDAAGALSFAKSLKELL